MRKDSTPYHDVINNMQLLDPTSLLLNIEALFDTMSRRLDAKAPFDNISPRHHTKCLPVAISPPHNTEGPLITTRGLDNYGRTPGELIGKEDRKGTR
jgi:hypothetical protein